MKSTNPNKVVRKPGRPPKGSKSVSPDSILERAFAKFAEYGFDAMSIRELAEELGVRDSLVHHHFGSKQDLWYCAVNHVLMPKMRELTAILLRNPESNDPKDSLVELTSRGLELVLSHRQTFQIVFRELEEDTERRDYLIKYSHAFLNLVDETLKKGVKQSKFLDIHPLSLHILMTGAARTLTSPNVLMERFFPIYQDEKNRKRIIKGIVTLIFDGLLK